MDIRLLTGFVTTAELGNVTLAAEKLHITQSALSRQIRALEDMLGVSLFQRIGKRMRLSPEGAALLPRMNAVLQASRTLQASAGQLRKGESGLLRVGACSQVIERFLPDFLARWQRDNPSIAVQIAEGGGADLNARLGEGAIQIAINAASFLEDHYEATTLGTLSLTAVATPELIGDGDGLIEIADIARHPLLLLNHRHASREMLDAACRLAGVSPQVALESNAPHTLLALAEAGSGIAVVPAAAPPAAGRLHARPLGYGGRVLSFDICAMWRISEGLPPYGLRFVELLRRHIADAAEPATGSEKVVLMRRVGA